MTKIGRNDPCPCFSRNRDGTRKKHKKCCIGRSLLFSPEETQRLHRRLQKERSEEYARFIKSHEQDKCYMCNLPYEQYNLNNPCPHWLLRPPGINKENIAAVLNQEGCFRPQAFLRWLAKIQNPLQSISTISMQKVMKIKFLK